MKWVYLVLSYVMPFFVMGVLLFLLAVDRCSIFNDLFAVIVITTLCGANCWVAYKYLYPLEERKKVIVNVFMQLNAMFIITITIVGLILAISYGEYFTRLIRIISYLWDAVCNIL